MSDPEPLSDAWFFRLNEGDLRDAPDVVLDSGDCFVSCDTSTRDRWVAAAALEWAAGMIQDDDPTNPPNEDYAERLRAKAREIREGV